MDQSIRIVWYDLPEERSVEFLDWLHSKYLPEVSKQRASYGPEIGQRRPFTTPGPFIQLGHFRVCSIKEGFDLSSWYANYRLPTIASMARAISARKKGNDRRQGKTL